MGALLEPCVAEMQTSENIPLPQLAQEVQEVLKGEGGEFYNICWSWVAPQGARSKALVYRDPVNFEFSTQASDQNEAWLIKFPAQQEYPEVCAIEAVYAECLRLCAIETPDTHFLICPMV